MILSARFADSARMFLRRKTDFFLNTKNEALVQLRESLISCPFTYPSSFAYTAKNGGNIL